MNTTAFFDYLSRRAEGDNAVIASLRRSLSFDPGTDTRVFSLVEPWLGDEPRNRRVTVYLIAGLWALSQRRTSGNAIPLAQALRRNANSTSAELRFTRLLDADRDELQWRLRQAITLLNASGTAIDWTQLLDDLLRWDSPSRFVQIQWARQYWRQGDPEPEAAGSATG
ncbi:MAG: type I-E CRISPR-associated protein Cse2/CasB [Cyanobacteriota bacterium]